MSSYSRMELRGGLLDIPLDISIPLLDLLILIMMTFNGRVDLSWLLTSQEGVRKATAWWLRQNILPQFQLARELEKQEL